MRSRFAIAICSCALLVASVAGAEVERLIESSRIRLGDLLANSPAALAEVDLGAAPPPGGSRLLSRDEILRQVRAAGQTPGNLDVPAVIRVTSRAKRLTADEVQLLVKPAIERGLKSGVTLAGLSVRKGLVLSPQATVGDVHFTKFPKREGAYKTTVMVDLVVAGEVVLRLPVSVTLELTVEGTRSLLERGAQVHLVIERGAARVSAVGVAQDDGDIGDVIPFRVQSTQKILRARIESRTSARVVGN